METICLDNSESAHEGNKALIVCSILAGDEERTARASSVQAVCFHPTTALARACFFEQSSVCRDCSIGQSLAIYVQWQRVSAGI